MVCSQNMLKTVLVCFFATFCFYGFSEAQYTMGILDLEAEGISGSEAKILSEELRYEITILIKSKEYLDSGYPRYNIVERSEMNKILGEFEFSKCVSDSCALEFGKLLSADRMVFGLVGKIGATYTFSVRIIDVETAKSIHTARKHFRGPIDELLTSVIKEVSRELIYGAVKDSISEDATDEKTDEKSVRKSEEIKEESQVSKYPRLTTKRIGLENDWFLAPVFKITIIQDDPAAFGGVRLGWLLNHKIAVGVHGCSILHTIDANEKALNYYAMPDKSLWFRNAGVDLEFIGNSEKLYQYSLHLLLGIFECGFEKDTGGTYKNRSKYIEPELTVSYNVTEWFRLCCGISYRFVSGVKLYGYNDSDLSKLAASITFEFGTF